MKKIIIAVIAVIALIVIWFIFINPLFFHKEVIKPTVGFGGQLFDKIQQANPSEKAYINPFE